MDPDTFLTTLYVLVDERCRGLPEVRRRGPEPALSRSEAITLALLGQWGRFGSERDFYRYADRRLRGAFPRLPHRTQLNRQIRRERDAIVAGGAAGADPLGGRGGGDEGAGGGGGPGRDGKRRGGGGAGGGGGGGR